MDTLSPDQLNPAVVLNPLVHYEIGIVNGQPVVQVLKSVYIRVPQIVKVLFVIGLGAYAQQTADKPSYLSRQCRSLIAAKQAFTERRSARLMCRFGWNLSAPGLTKELIQNAKPGEVEHLLARRLKSPPGVSVNAFLIKYENKRILIDAGSSGTGRPGRLANCRSPSELRGLRLRTLPTSSSPTSSWPYGGLMNGNMKVFPNATIHIKKYLQRRQSTWVPVDYVNDAVE